MASEHDVKAILPELRSVKEANSYQFKHQSLAQCTCCAWLRAEPFALRRAATYFSSTPLTNFHDARS